MSIARTTITNLARIQHATAIARGDFLFAQGECYRRHGTNAVRHLTDSSRRLLARLGKLVGWRRVKRDVTIVSVGTLKRWWNQLIAEPVVPIPHGGKARTSAEIEALVVELALANSWDDDASGRRSLASELAKVGVVIHDTTIRAILRRHGIPTAPQRGADGMIPA